MTEKITKIIKAGAIGDALGYNVEFFTWDFINICYDGPINFSNCDGFNCSDDTQMTLFCLEALTECSNQSDAIIEKIYEYYLDWYATQFPNLSPRSEFAQQAMLHKQHAPGKTCLAALATGVCGTIENKINDSKGCGGIMRVASIAFLEKPLSEIITLGARQAAITHGHPDGYLSAGFLAGLLHLGLKGVPYTNAYHQTKIEISKHWGCNTFLNYLDILENTLSKTFITSPEEMTNWLGEGWTGESALGLAIYAFMRGGTFEETLVIAANHRGDSDSTASIAGQLYAAFKPLSQEDLKLFDKLDLAGVIEKSLGKFLDKKF